MTAKHREVEEHFRDLLAANGLEPPDRVLYEPASVGFVWEEPKVVVYVDFEPAA
jgi:hypothetical protein